MQRLHARVSRKPFPCHQLPTTKPQITHHPHPPQDTHAHTHTIHTQRLHAGVSYGLPPRCRTAAPPGRARHRHEPHPGRYMLHTYTYMCMYAFFERKTWSVMSSTPFRYGSLASFLGRERVVNGWMARSVSPISAPPHTQSLSTFPPQHTHTHNRTHTHTHTSIPTPTYAGSPMIPSDRPHFRALHRCGLHTHTNTT